MRISFRALCSICAMVLIPIGAAHAATSRERSPHAGSARPAAGRSNVGGSVLEADFNGDGYQDLAVAALYKTINGVANAGSVNVLYGSATGLTMTGNQFWTQASPGMPGPGAQANSLFGRALASGDFNGDGYADLAIAAPEQTTGQGLGSAGSVTVLYGSAAGLTTTGASYWTQDTVGIPGVSSQPKAVFGRALAAGDQNGDGYADLDIDAALQDINGIQDAGGISVLYGSAAGVTASGAQFWWEGTPGIVGGGAQTKTRFGWCMAVGDYNHDGYMDLAAGSPGWAVGSKGGAGGVNVIYGSATGLTVTGNQLWTQDLLPGQSAQAGALFGRSVTEGDFNGDGYDDMAAGAPSENVGTARSAGALSVIYGSASGLTATGAQFWNENSPGIAGTGAQTGDHFARHIGRGDFNGDGYRDLAIGVLGKDVTYQSTLVLNAGAIIVLYGSAPGLTSLGSQFWTQGANGIQGVPQANDRLGRAANGFDFDGDGYSDLAAGASGDTVGTIVGAGGVNVIYGSAAGLASPRNQLLNQDSPGILGGGAEAGAAFGSAFPGGPAGSAGLAD